jgi:hypothetical protein
MNQLVSTWVAIPARSSNQLWPRTVAATKYSNEQSELGRGVPVFEEWNARTLGAHVDLPLDGPHEEVLVAPAAVEDGDERRGELWPQRRWQNLFHRIHYLQARRHQ